jgi:protein-L-isoaspartate O-methyltransferase
MNAQLALFTTASGAADHKAANLLAAARALAPRLDRARPLDRRLVASVMTTAFGASDAEGGWLWRDAYDAVEAALVLQLRRLAPHIARLEDAPAEVAALLAELSALSLTHTRRSEEQLAMDQFSTPPELGVLAVLAAQVRPGDRVLEPSAGTGLLAILAEVCGGALTLNERAAGRAAMLEALFPLAALSRHDAAHLADLLPEAGGFHVALVNPPFQQLEAHLHAALDALADGGRMAAIAPERLFAAPQALRALARRGRIVLRLRLPERAYARHGTSVSTGLIVIDRGPGRGAVPELVCVDTLADAARAAAAVEARPTAQARPFRADRPAPLRAAAARPPTAPTGRLGFLAQTAPVAYEPQPWSGEGREVGLYQAYRLGRIRFPRPAPHPSPLVESGPMASVAPPAPTYRPRLPARVTDEALLSEAQMESVIYAGQAHAQTLPGAWVLGQAPHQAILAPPGHPGAARFRRGFFLGDGTGCGKGRQIAGVIADNLAQGRVRAVWLSKNDALLEDARRDWRAIGGEALDIVPQSAWRQAEAICLDRGVLYTTYATLRQPARGARPSRLDQIATWLGADFDGVIVFDEAHAMANAAGGGEGARGARKASLQGMAGLALQNRLPNARVLYVSATGATTPENLAYAARLGLWGGPDAPFPTREAFLDAVDAGGVAVMELIARELKAMGLYIARSLSFEGVEYEALRHRLTDDDRAIWDAWADAYQLIHQNLRAALEAVGLTRDGKPRSGLAASAVMSAFEGAKQRFFGHLLSGLKAPSLVAAIRRDLAEGRSAVVQVVSTNAAVMERRLAAIPLEEWGNLAVDLTPKDQALDYLMGAFPIMALEAIEDEDGAVTLVPVKGDDGQPVVSQEALRLREALVSHLAGLPAVPGVLDALLEAFGTDRVAEITGRPRRVVTRDGRRMVERRSAAAAKAETDAFMSGQKRVLVFSDAGGVGRSYHADLGAANRQRRVHYLVEPGWRADAAIQGLGRSHRTNQACPPLFRPVTIDIHGEKRFLSTIARRLDSLGALTRGERRTAGAGLFRAEDNLESPWAQRALQAFYAALRAGDVPAMDLEAFEARTGLRLLDDDGRLKAPDHLPPMNTFLNRLLALRVADQNALFAAFEAILASILERAAQSGALDRGVEDIVADDVMVLDETVLRTDAATGAQTRLLRFQVRTRRTLTSADAALAGLDRAQVGFAVNARSGRAALVVSGLTTTDDQDRLTPAVRLVRPQKQTAVPLKTFEESAWTDAGEAAWRAAWAAELAGADPWVTGELTLVCGLLLPIWSRLPQKAAQVRRLGAPDGRRWLGRLIEPGQVPALKAALGLTDLAGACGDPGQLVALILKDGTEVGLGGGLWLRRTRVMDRLRIEVVGAGSQRAAFTALGCFVEIINYTARVFAPTGQPEVLAAILARWPAQSIGSAEARA